MKMQLLVGVAVLAAVGGMVRAGSATTKPDADDVKVALTDCPQAVQDTLKTAVGAGTITEIEKENENGVADYSADATIDGKPYEIKVSLDGKLLKKELDDDGEKGEKKGGKEDDDKK